MKFILKVSLFLTIMSFVIATKKSVHLKSNGKKGHYNIKKSKNGPGAGGPGGHGGNKPHWDYSDFETGPWAEGDCLTNSRPSPVNLVVENDAQCNGDNGVYLESIDKSQKTNFFSNGHTLESKGQWDVLYVMEDGEELRYDAQQFHFHSPSEHTVNGEHADLEMHIVHKLHPAYKGKGDMVAVASFLFNESDDDQDDIFDLVHPDDACVEKDCPPIAASDFELNFDDADFEYESYYHYKGSFTTPPCSPIANWFISADIREISGETLDAFKGWWSQDPHFSKNMDIHGDDFDAWVGNNRPTQGDVEPEYFNFDCTAWEEEDYSEDY